MTKEWRLLRTGPLSGALNMALDEALFEAVAAGRSAPVLRLYRWKPAALTLGYAQQGARVVNLAACRELGLDVVRRATGGRAVLHDREVTYAVIAPEQGGIFPGGILENYRVIAGALCHALRGLGLKAELVPGRSRDAGRTEERESACFTAPSSYELVVDGLKVAGSAQKRGEGIFLQHGSIPLDLDPEKLFCSLDTRGRLSVAEGGARLAASVGWLNRFLPSPLCVEEVEEAVVASFSEALGLDLVAGEPDSLEWERASWLAAQRYANPAWSLAGITGPGIA